MIKVDHAIVRLLEEFQINDGTDLRILERLPGDRLTLFAGVGFGKIDGFFRRINGVEAFIAGVVEGADVAPVAFSVGKPAALRLATMVSTRVDFLT